jgi:serine/threonine-protein kinase
MSDQLLPSIPTLPPALAERLDRVCDRFEAAWKMGHKPRLEEYVIDTPESEQATFLQELIPLEIAYRRQEGDNPSTADYQDRFPALDPTWIAQQIADFSQEGQPATHAKEGATARYRFFGEINRGGMGVILKGRDLHLGRDLAVKVLLEEHQNNPGMVQRFIEEAQIGGQLQHPGIVPVYEQGRFADGRPYFSMKLVKGCTLAVLLESRTDLAVDRPRFLAIFEQVCQTLAYAHSRRVIHRDLKPSNVMVGAFGEVQVMDWGMAKVLGVGGTGADQSDQATEQRSVIRTVRTETPGSQSQTGAVVGTLPYMAPEQALGAVRQLDERCDVFSLGAILCEILTGEPPYIADTVEALHLQAARADLADALARLDACGADEDLLRLAKRCLAAKPENRPRDAGVVARELIAYLATVEKRLRQAELERAAAEVRTKEERKRRRLTVALAASVLATVLLGAGGWLWFERHRQVREAAKAQQIHDVLAKATLLRDQGKWPEALAAASTLLSEDEVDVPVRRQVQEFLADLQMLERVAEIRANKGDEFEEVDTDADYAKAFKDYGIDVNTLAITDAADQISTRPPVIATELTTALDDWILERKRRKPEDPGWRRLVEVVQAADRDAWRNHLRDMLAQQDIPTLRKMAESAKVQDLPVQSLQLMGQLLAGAGEHQAAVSLLRMAQQHHPNDVWINYTLASSLQEMRQRDQAIRFYAVAAALRPGSAAHQLGLGRALHTNGDHDGAVAAFHEAIRLNPNYPSAYNDLGFSLEAKGDHDKAIDAYHTAIRLRPNFPEAFNNLGLTLEAKKEHKNAIEAYHTALSLKRDYAKAYSNLSLALGAEKDFEGAIDACRTAIRLKPDYAHAYHNLGWALIQSKRPIEETITAFRKATHFKPDFAEAYNGLGIALRVSRDYDGAIDAYHTAIRLKPSYPNAHHGLGIALGLKGDFDGAINAYREAIRLRPNSAELYQSYQNLAALLLRVKGDVDETITRCRDAIRLKPKSAAGYLNLGRALQRKGQLDEALVALKRGDELDSKDPRRSLTRKKWISDCEQLIELNKRLPALLGDKDKPADAAEAIEFAKLCYIKGWYGTSARLHKEAFAAKPKLAQDLRTDHRYNGACTAALAGCVPGKDAPPLDEEARARWRMQALDWLRADLVLWTKQLAGGTAQDRRAVQGALQQWQRDPDLAGPRDEAALAKLPKAEQEAWCKFWVEVAVLLQRARQKE